VWLSGDKSNTSLDIWMANILWIRRSSDSNEEIKKHKIKNGSLLMSHAFYLSRASDESDACLQSCNIS
jgi:hypothetical protein